ITGRAPKLQYDTKKPLFSLSLKNMFQKKPIMLSISPVAIRSSWPCTARLIVRASAKAVTKVIVHRQPAEDVIKAKGVRSWPTWGCGVSKFPWTYKENETCYILEGKVVVTPDGGEAVEINAGDLAIFPAGMSCIWDVKAPIDKHYNFH
ncbi:hypothetical protein Vretifemale_19833, partial [Volvox reticuliferus]